MLACLQFRYPVVLTYVGYDLDAHLGGEETTRRRIERRVFRGLSALVAATVAQSERGAKELPRPGLTRNVVLANGVDRVHFCPVPRQAAREALGWHEQDPVVLFAADPTRMEKRFELCRQAVTVARRVIPVLRLKVAADVPPEQMPQFYSAADVLVLTSVAEGSPNVVKEALSCNLPVVSVDVGDVADVVRDASNCHVCPPQADALAEAIIAVVRAIPSRAESRGLTERFSWVHVTERLLQIYLTALERRPGPLGFLRRARDRGSPRPA
jgi:glycosyltransferase involved in cell wall biosynthesis